MMSNGLDAKKQGIAMRAFDEGVNYYNQEMYEPAERKFKEVLDIMLASDGAWNGLGLVYKNRHVDALNRLVKTGRFQFQQDIIRDLYMSKLFFDIAIDLNPGNQEAKVNLLGWRQNMNAYRIGIPEHIENWSKII